MNWFKKKAKQIVNIDPKIGATVIRFMTHGCQGEIHEFEWIGVIVDVNHNYGDWYYNKIGYKVQILKNNKGWEQRNYPEEKKYYEVPSWYLQNLGGFFVCYD